MAMHVSTGVKVCQTGEVWGPIWTLWTLGQDSASPWEIGHTLVMIHREPNLGLGC